MERRQLGSSGPSLEVVGLGTWRRLEAAVDGDGHRRLIVHALDAGVRVFDSSPMYGAAESLLADGLGERRGEAFVATKIWAQTASDGKVQLDRALRLFGGRVDLMQIHNLVAWKDQLPLLERARDKGNVGFIGVTHYSEAAVDDLMAIMQSGRVDVVQVPYNPHQRTVERRLLPLADELGIGVLVMRPFGEGSLLQRAPSPNDLAPLADFGVTTWPQALLKWGLSDARCTVAIPATSQRDRVDENASAGTKPWFGPEERTLVSRLAGAA